MGIQNNCRTILIISTNSFRFSQKYQRHYLAIEANKRGIKTYYISKVVFNYYINLQKVNQLIKLIINQIFKRRSRSGKKEHVIIIEKLFFEFGWLGKLLKLFKQDITSHIKKVVDNYDKKSLLIISYIPFQGLMELQDLGYSVVFCRVHELKHLTNCSEAHRTEEKVVANIFHVGCDSQYLLNISKKVKVNNCNLFRILPGVTDDLLKTDINSVPKFQKKKIKKLLYFGSIADYLDLDLLIGLANHGFKITMIGNVSEVVSKELIKHGINIQKAQEITNIYNSRENFNAIILPYKIFPRNLKVIPAKIFECLTFGLPIFASALPYTNEPFIKDKINTFISIKDLKEMLNGRFAYKLPWIDDMAELSYSNRLNQLLKNVGYDP